MKKFVSLIIAVLLVITLVFTGCTENKEPDKNPTQTQALTESTQDVTKATEKETPAPTQKPTPAPTQTPTQAVKEESSDISSQMYISDEAYYTMEFANYIQLNDDGTAVMQINLLEAMIQVTGTYTGDANGIITFSEMVDSFGNVAIQQGAELHKYVDGLMILYGVKDGFSLQGWNAPPAYQDGSFFRSPDSPDFERIHG